MKRPALLERLRDHGDRPFLLNSTGAWSYGELIELIVETRAQLEDVGIQAGSVVSVAGDYRPRDIAVVLALLELRCIAVMIPDVGVREEYEEIAGCEVAVRDERGELGAQRLDPKATHPLVQDLRDRAGAGFVIFSSGSEGPPRAVLHDVDRFLDKFASAGKPLRTVAFLVFDHIAGLDTLFYTIEAGGALVVPDDRSPRAVSEAIERHSAQVLPTSPTFLRLLRLSDACVDFDFSSLEVITYGSEPMDEGGLAWLDRTFPEVALEQKYGTSEFGSPRSRSRGRDSLWLQLKSDEIEAKVLDGVLWIRSAGAMLGYLNAASPFTDDGWFCTGDEAVVDGEWIQILGRKSELIFVGGEKVFPAVVEGVLLEHDAVEQALVFGDKHPLTGQIVCADVLLRVGADEERETLKDIRRHCRTRLPRHAVPMRLSVTDATLSSHRSKKVRRRPGP